jgi:hypothetical protein
MPFFTTARSVHRAARASRSAAALAVLAVLAACGGGGSGDDAPSTAPAQEGMLRLVRTPAELETSLKLGLRAAAGLGTVTAAPPQVSGTYTLEPGIDELDAVRYDGSLLFVAPSRRFTCCFVGGPTALPVAPPPPTAQAVRLLRTEPAAATAREVGRIPLESGVSVQGMYATGRTLVAVTSEAFYGTYGPLWSVAPYWSTSRFGLRFFDVGDPAAPRRTLAATIDGVFVDSRRIGDRVYIVSRHAPRVLLDSAGAGAIDATPLERLLPQVTIDGVSRPLVDPRNCYVTRDRAGEAGAPVLTSLTVVPLADPASMTTTCYDEEAYGAYVSDQAIYLLQPRTPAIGAAPRTRIHRFDIGAARPVYRGSAEVDGMAWGNAQPDFRISEAGGRLRLFTTESTTDTVDPLDHRLFVLQPSATAPELVVVGQLPNARRPEEIGKPGEALYGVRLLGNRAYASTFERIDPLYVFDLSNPADPRIAGSLEMPGFSDFLHAVSDDLLLGIGRADTGGVRVALFDVSAPGRPRELGGVTIGGPGSHSEAQYDRHAFAYLAGTAADRFAVPVNRFADGGGFAYERSALELFEVRNKATPALARLISVGAIVARRASDTPPAGPVVRNRAFIDGPAVYYVADDDVYGAAWAAPEARNGPF